MDDIDSEALVQQIAEVIAMVADDCGPHEPANVTYARAVLPLIEAQVAPLRDERDQLHREWRTECDLRQEVQNRLRAAESALRQVREDLTALADEWETEYGPESEAHRVFGPQTVSISFAVKTLRRLARVGAADPAHELVPHSPDDPNDDRVACICGDWAWDGNDPASEAEFAAHASSVAADTQPEGLCVTHGGSPWPPAESRCAAGDPWDDGLVCADTQPEGAGALTLGAGQGPSLGEIDPPLLDALRPMIARYGALGVKHTVDLLTEHPTPTAGSKVDTAPEADEEPPAFSVSQGEWTLTGRYDGPGNIRLYRDGEEHSRRTCEGYRIWNYAAHLSDLIAEVEYADDMNPPADTAPESGEGR